MVRVLLADDNAGFRGALRRLLERDPDIDIVAEAEDGARAVDLADELGPDVVVMDVSMPRLDGLEATHRLRDRRPDIAVLLLSIGNTEQDIAAGLSGGAAAYLLKGTPAAEIADAIKHFGRSQTRDAGPVRP
jgi:DNA-binding NarL/FixJ family response regulator